MKMRVILKPTIIFLLVLTLIILVSLGSYKLGVYKATDLKTNYSASEQDFKTQLLQKAELCLEGAKKEHTDRWNRACDSQGKAAGCSLPSEQVKHYDDVYQQNKENCIDLYK